MTDNVEDKGSNIATLKQEEKDPHHPNCNTTYFAARADMFQIVNGVHHHLGLLSAVKGKPVPNKVDTEVSLLYLSVRLG